MILYGLKIFDKVRRDWILTVSLYIPALFGFVENNYIEEVLRNFVNNLKSGAVKKYL